MSKPSRPRRLTVVSAAILTLACGGVSTYREDTYQGDVSCQISGTDSSASLSVEITLDSAAAFGVAILRLMPEQTELSEGVIPNRLSADLMGANGKMVGCGGVPVQKVTFTASGNLLTTGSWLRITARERVDLTLKHGSETIRSLHVVPGSRPDPLTWGRSR